MRFGEARFVVKLFGRRIMRSILVWVLHNGEWPVLEVDHVNRDPLDDNIENLRLATHSQNAANRFCASNSSSGRKGVSWHLASGKWQSRIRVHGTLIHLG